MADLIDRTLGELPSWLRGPSGEAWHVALGSVREAMLQAAKEATKARFATSAPGDALFFLGQNRALAPGREESAATFRARIRAARDAWEGCGTGPALCRAIDALYPQYSFNTSLVEYWGSPDFEPDDARWARFHLETWIPHWGPAPHWDAFRWDDGSHWDVTAPVGEISTLRRTLHQWTPAYAKCERLRVHISGGAIVDFANPLSEKS